METGEWPLTKIAVARDRNRRFPGKNHPRFLSLATEKIYTMLNTIYCRLRPKSFPLLQHKLMVTGEKQSKMETTNKEFFWTRGNEDLLVELSSEKLCLYAVNSPEYADSVIKVARLAVIAVVLGTNPYSIFFFPKSKK